MKNLNDYAAEVHKANQKWWHDINTGEYLHRNIGELLMLCVSELSEAMEGYRKSLKDDKLPQYNMFDVELVDCLIRIFDIAGQRGIDLEQIYKDKQAYNAIRKDHTKEHRLSINGKKF